MKIGIIETGKPSATLTKSYGRYPDMFENLIGPFLPTASFFAVSVVSGEPLVNADQANGWIITGSRHGAYDDLPWISALEEFSRNSILQKIPLVGVCFGHQLIAQAMGGVVQRSNKGWGVGPQSYSVSNKPAWMTKFNGTYRSHAIHQDQVMQQPPNSTVISSSDFCEYAGLVYGDPEFPTALTVQSHPEMSSDFVKDIGAERLSRVVPQDVLAKGFSTLGQSVHNKEWGETMAQYFLRGNP